MSKAKIFYTLVVVNGSLATGVRAGANL